MLRWEEGRSLCGYPKFDGYSGKAFVFRLYSEGGLYSLRAFLPGYRTDFEKKDTLDAMKGYAENLFKKWLDFASLTECPGAPEAGPVEPERRMIPEPNRIITGFAALVIISIGYLFAAIALSLALTVSLFSAFPYCGAAALCGLAGSYLVRTMERTTNPDATPGAEPRTE
ncbi:MAG: hypothetical protein WC114_09285, partial [Smithellaceae bacterium]